MERGGERRGAKYRADQDVAEIAGALRKDLRAAVQAGTLPACTYSVRISRFSMGESLSVRIRRVSFPLLARAHVLSDPRRFYEGPRYTAQARHVLALVEELVAAYRRPDSGSSTDHLYSHVGFDGDEERQQRDAITREAGCTGCTWCSQRGCGLCASGGVVPPPTVEEDRAELNALRRAPAVEPALSITPVAITFPCRAATLYPN
jgi:hypothetical protein